ncbi:MAG: M16 family metallopeptidase [Gammaproteobacteria bacterium]
MTVRPLFAALLATSLVACAQGPASRESAPPSVAVPPPAPALQVPVEYYRLDNGLRVVLSRDTTLPTATVGVYYEIGFRIEPKGRTGFAHLFEHMLFQGTPNLPKGGLDQIVSGNGGALNGSTRFDFTNYYEVVPAHVLESVLWVEADRMRAVDLNPASLANQQGVVKNEVRVNVLNRPYGGFPWLSLPQYANTNWYNAHNFYGDLTELDAATLDDVKSFFDSYYTPSNAVLVVAGDFETAQAKEWIARYFGVLPSRATPPRPDISEPPQTAERRASYVDKFAPRPALAIGWQMPERNTRDWLAMGVVDELLLQGDASLLRQRIVRDQGITSSIDGGINLLGNLYNYNGPMLFTAYLIHDAKTPSAAVVKAIDAAVAEFTAAPPSAEDMARAVTTLRSGLYDVVGSSTRFGLVDLLASFALFDNDPARINRLETELRSVTPEEVQAAARKYLRPENRTVLVVEAGAAPKAPPPTAAPAQTAGGAR